MVTALLCVQVEEVREVMENEMRTQLRRQAAAHTDHLRDVLKIQEQELKVEFEQVREGNPQGPGGRLNLSTHFTG